MVDENNPNVLLLQHSKRCARSVLEAVGDGNVSGDELDALRFRLDWVINMMTRSAGSFQIDNELLRISKCHSAHVVAKCVHASQRSRCSEMFH